MSTDARDEGVRLTEEERAAIVKATGLYGLSHQTLFREFERILTARLAEVTAEREAALDRYAEREQRWHWNLIREGNAIAEAAREKARADAAEARLGEGVVEWGVRWSDGDVISEADSETAREIIENGSIHRTLVTRTVHTTPWVQVSEP